MGDKASFRENASAFFRGGTIGKHMAKSWRGAEEGSGTSSFSSGSATASERERMDTVASSSGAGSEKSRGHTFSFSDKMSLMEGILEEKPELLEEVEHMEKKCNAFRDQTKKLIRLAKEVTRTGKMFQEASSQFLSEMSNINFYTSEDMDEFEDFDERMQHFRKTVDVLDNVRTMQLLTIENIVIGPLEEMLRETFQDVKASKKNFDRVADEYHYVHNKYHHSASKTKSDTNKMSEAKEELLDKRREFTRQNYELVTKLTDATYLNTFQNIECLCGYMFSQLASFHQGYETMQDLEPDLQGLSKQAQHARESFQDRKRKEHERGLEHVDQMMQVAVESRQKNLKNIQEKRGYLYKKSNSVVGDWKRRYCILKDGQLSYYRNVKDARPAGVIHLLFCTVKTAPPEIDRYSTFELVSMSAKRSYYLQAENEEELQDWVSSIQNTIGALINQQSASHKVSRERVPSQAAQQIIQTLRQAPGNSCCADCGAADPTWASINLGVLLCIECSGIHRSMGTHVSKVRSLTLDTWDPVLAEMMRSIGNEFANSIWERQVPMKGASKPVEDDDRNKKEQWIRAKYEYRVFLGKDQDSSGGDAAAAEDELLAAAAAGNIHDLYGLLARGTLVSCVDGSGNTPLHRACESDQVLATLLLLQLGANPDATNNDHRTPLHCGAAAGTKGCVNALLQNSADTTIKSSLGETPLDEAVSKGMRECEDLLLQSKLNALHELAGDGSPAPAVGGGRV